MTPVTYRVVDALKRAEHEDYFDRDTNFTPFSLSVQPAQEQSLKQLHSSICMPSSTTRPGGRPKNSVAVCELRDRNENSAARQRHMPGAPGRDQRLAAEVEARSR